MSVHNMPMSSSRESAKNVTLKLDWKLLHLLNGYLTSFIFQLYLHIVSTLRTIRFTFTNMVRGFSHKARLLLLLSIIIIIINTHASLCLSCVQRFHKRLYN